MQQKELDEIEKIFGKTVQAGYKTLIPKCPLCSEPYSFAFSGTIEVWNCPVCNNSGNWQTLVDMLSKVDGWRNVLLNKDNPKPPEGLVLLSQWHNDHVAKRILSGFECLDRMIGGFEDSMLTVLTGKRGEGKSTFASQLALNAIQNNVPVFFYSGELNVAMFRRWFYSQACGERFLLPYKDDTGETRYKVELVADARISKWLGNKLVIYDNTIVKASERNSILERMRQAKNMFKCGLFIIDNLMTAKYAIENERNYFRAQSNFVGELVDFAQETQTHIMLVAHPRKGEMDGEDLNDNVAGSSDVTNRASNVIRISKQSDQAVLKDGFDSTIQVTKNREYGKIGKLKFNFNKMTKRFEPVEMNSIKKYGWEHNT
jgi:twinkle protein